MTNGKIIYLNHLQKRMFQRGITLEQVQETISNADRVIATYPNAKTGAERKKHVKQFLKDILCVVVEYRTHARVVVTAYWRKR